MELIHRKLNIPNKESYSQKINQLTELITEKFIDNFYHLSISQIILEVNFVPFTRKQ